MSMKGWAAYLMSPSRRQAKVRHLVAHDEPPRPDLSYHAICGVTVRANGNEKPTGDERDGHTPDGVPAAQKVLRQTCQKPGKPCRFSATVVPFPSAADEPEPVDRDWVARQRRAAGRSS